MNTPSLSYELGDLWEHQAEHERQTRLEVARSLYSCPECGSQDGMVVYYPENIATALQHPDQYELPQLFQYKDATYALFATCDECNAAGILPPGYKVTSPDVAASLQTCDIMMERR